MPLISYVYFLKIEPFMPTLPVRGCLEYQLKRILKSCLISVGKSFMSI